MLAAALAAGERVDATVVNMRFVKPLDEALLKELAAQHVAWVTLEENTIAGGAGSAVAELLDSLDLGRPRLAVGLPDRFIEHGSREQCLEDAGLDERSVIAKIELWWQSQACNLNSGRGTTRMTVAVGSGPP